VVGSNISNILLILGLAAIVRPLAVQVQLVRRDVPILIVVSALLLVITVDGRVSRLEGGFLLVAAALYTGAAFWQARRTEPTVHEDVLRGAPVPERPRRGLWLDGIFLLLGLAGLVAGADLFVRGALAAAATLGVSEAVIGLTVVAVGTSLPELATTAVAAFRNEGDIAIGNVVGSNIFNVVGILGATATVHPLAKTAIGLFDPAVALAAAVLLLPLLITGFRLTRKEGALLVIFYAAYVYSVLP
jgi:cation:H+ antiporter